jgi:small subunit ribosomal protein S9
MENKTYHWGTGRRKTAIARVRLRSGNGEITINKRTAEDYVGNRRTLTKMLTSALTAVREEGKLDVIVNVKGGGISSQVGAIRHGISRALLEVNDEYRATLKSLGFLTRDARVKERKKPGQKRARKKFQFSKR